MDSPNVCVQSLLEELSRLSKQQSEILQIAVYMKMDTATAKQYDQRAQRISEIIKLIQAG